MYRLASQVEIITINSIADNQNTQKNIKYNEESIKIQGVEVYLTLFAGSPKSAFRSSQTKFWVLISLGILLTT